MSRNLLLLAALWLAAAFVVAGCSYLESPSTSTVAETTTVPEEGGVATTAPPTTITAQDAPCLVGDRPFVTDGLVSAFGSTNGDAGQISGIRWSGYQGCERVVVDLLTVDGAPAGTLDQAGVEYQANAGVIRVNLPSTVAKSAIADSLIDGELVKRAFVVATTDGHLAVDIHLAAGRGYAVRAFELDSPSRIAIDVREQSDAIPVIGARVGDTVVIVSPQTGRIDSSFTVTGYSKGPHDEVTVAVATNESDDAVATEVMTLTGPATLWREFTSPFPGMPPEELRILVTLGRQDELATELTVDATPLDDLEPSDI